MKEAARHIISTSGVMAAAMQVVLLLGIFAWADTVAGRCCKDAVIGYTSGMATQVRDVSTPYYGERVGSFPAGDYELAYDDTARMHDPLLMRFTPPDPLASDFLSLSPWSHCAANPANNIDTDGMQFDAIKRWWNRNNMSIRTEGLFNCIGGILESIAGATVGAGSGWTGIGAIGSGIVFIHGCDIATNGFLQLITGKESSTLTSKGVEAIGISHQSAKKIDASISIVAVGGAAFVKSSHTFLVNYNFAPRKPPKSFFEGTKYSPKVKNQINLGDFHSFPESVTAFEADGTVTKIIGGDGVARTKLSIPGYYKGQKGFFEFIKEPNGEISHRFFNVIFE